MQITKKQFINYYKTHTYDQMQKEWKCSRNKIAKLAEKYGVSKSPGRRSNLEII